jgi:AcrR family transcriptional regulator
MASADEPRHRLLEAAGETFAAKGFEGATVRDICKRAGANIAAVNYYFRDKERLYIEAVKHAACGVPGQAPSWPAGTPPAVKLRDFIYLLVARLMDRDRPEWHARLMMREMAQPTSACAELVRDYIGPMSAVLQGILGEVLPPQTPRWKRFMVGASVVGQCLHHTQNKPIIQLLVGAEDYQRFDAPTLADHITQFSLAALGLAPPAGAGREGAPAKGGGTRGRRARAAAGNAAAN